MDTDFKGVELIENEPYQIEYYDHFEGVVYELKLIEVGFYLEQSERYLFFCAYRDTEGTPYNRTGIIKSDIVHLHKLKK